MTINSTAHTGREDRRGRWGREGRVDGAADLDFPALGCNAFGSVDRLTLGMRSSLTWVSIRRNYNECLRKFGRDNPARMARIPWDYSVARGFSQAESDKV
jgi:hypothetical protein